MKRSSSRDPLGDWLRSGDPATDGREPEAAERSALRRRTLASVPARPSAGRWLVPAAALATAAALVLVIAPWERLAPGPSPSGAPRAESTAPTTASSGIESSGGPTEGTDSPVPPSASRSVPGAETPPSDSFETLPAPSAPGVSPAESTPGDPTGPRPAAPTTSRLLAVSDPGDAEGPESPEGPGAAVPPGPSAAPAEGQPSGAVARDAGIAPEGGARGETSAGVAPANAAPSGSPDRAAADSAARRQQVQFATTNGTRVIWVLDAELAL